MNALLSEIKNCTVCSQHLPFPPRPVLSASPNSKIVIIGQAPGTKVNESGIPWDDKSGENLRRWLNLNNETFYDPKKIAIIPMGFCYPGKGKSGDLPPRKECAPLWHEQLFDHLKEVELIVLIGKYAQEYYLKEQMKKTLTETVRNFEAYLPRYLVLPHPSPRNNIWMKKNPWFERELLPQAKAIIGQLLE
ncbi:MAG: IclR family transcriptional regulator [Crocinitomicaceae bacterium]|nr:IclR family transcriptional regulator [Crocinitomicaceae bacterium]|tara:strand:- start:31276 stop:31848 length:573 start_codon:yes stop_codon:yes gene_type:complete